MRKFKTVFMRGGTSKGCMFHKEDLPEDRKEWDNIFLQCMGDPDPKQIDGLGGTVSSNNKIIVGKSQVDYKSNCGNMTAAVGPYAVEEGMVDIVEPITTVRMLNRNTDKYINVTVPIDPETKTFAQEGDCAIAGVDGTAAELKVQRQESCFQQEIQRTCWIFRDLDRLRRPFWMCLTQWSWCVQRISVLQAVNCRKR